MVSILLLAGCSDVDDDDSEPSNTLGNTASNASAFISARAADSSDENSSSGSLDFANAKAAESVDTGDESANAVITKFASDEYVKKLLAKAGITNYIQLYDASSRTTEIKIDDSSGKADVVDRFLIVDANGNTLATFTEGFPSSDIAVYLDSKLYSSSVTQKAKSERVIKEFGTNADTLRLKIEPNNFRVVTKNSDLTKKYSFFRKL